MKTVVAVFTNKGARVLVNPENIEILRHYANVVVDPDLHAVMDTPPEHWKLVSGKIVPMTDAEKPTQEALLSKPFVIEKEIEKRIEVPVERVVERVVPVVPIQTKVMLMVLGAGYLIELILMGLRWLSLR